MMNVKPFVCFFGLVEPALFTSNFEVYIFLKDRFESGEFHRILPVLPTGMILSEFNFAVVTELFEQGLPDNRPFTV